MDFDKIRLTDYELELLREFDKCKYIKFTKKVANTDRERAARRLDHFGLVCYMGYTGTQSSETAIGHDYLMWLDGTTHEKEQREQQDRTTRIISIIAIIASFIATFLSPYIQYLFTKNDVKEVRILNYPEYEHQETYEEGDSLPSGEIPLPDVPSSFEPNAESHS